MRRKKLIKIASEGNRTKHGISNVGCGCNPCGVMFGKGMDVTSVFGKRMDVMSMFGKGLDVVSMFGMDVMSILWSCPGHTEQLSHGGGGCWLQPCFYRHEMINWSSAPADTHPVRSHRGVGNVQLRVCFGQGLFCF